MENNHNVHRTIILIVYKCASPNEASQRCIEDTTSEFLNEASQRFPHICKETSGVSDRLYPL